MREAPVTRSGTGVLHSLAAHTSGMPSATSSDEPASNRFRPGSRMAARKMSTFMVAIRPPRPARSSPSTCSTTWASVRASIVEASHIDHGKLICIQVDGRDAHLRSHVPGGAASAAPSLLNKPGTNGEREGNATFVPVASECPPAPQPDVATCPTGVGKGKLTVDAGCPRGGSLDVRMVLQHPEQPVGTCLTSRAGSTSHFPTTLKPAGDPRMRSGRDGPRGGPCPSLRSGREGWIRRTTRSRQAVLLAGGGRWRNAP